MFKKLTTKIFGSSENATKLNASSPEQPSAELSDSSQNLVVASKKFIAESVIEFELRHPEGLDLPTFAAGAHIDIHIQPDLIRQYSLSNSPADLDRYRLAVLIEEEGKGGSLALRDNIGEGDAITASHPRNHFPLSEAAEFTLLVAGGIGVTPLLSMAYELRDSGRDFRFYYRCKSRARAAYADLLVTEFGDAVNCFFSDEGGRENFDLDHLLSDLPANTELYTCGANSFMDFVTETAQKYLPEDHIHLERFYPLEQTDTSALRDFELFCQKSDLTLRVPADKSIVDVLYEQGIEIPISCSEGVCGSCITAFVEGEVDHRDSVLSKSEREKKRLFTPCCSRASSDRLVLDL